jgi:hypothetical protein
MMNPPCGLQFGSRPVGVVLKVKFTPEEDRQLLDLVANHGYRDWNQVAAFMPNRNARQCRERYNYYLDPSLRETPWTPEEDCLLIAKEAECGMKWHAIAQFFTNRSDIALRNRWQLLDRHRTGNRNIRREQNAQKKAIPPSRQSSAERLAAPLSAPSARSDAIHLAPHERDDDPLFGGIFEVLNQLGETEWDPFHAYSSNPPRGGGIF